MRIKDVKKEYLICSCILGLLQIGVFKFEYFVDYNVSNLQRGVSYLVVFAFSSVLFYIAMQAIALFITKMQTKKQVSTVGFKKWFLLLFVVYFVLILMYLPVNKTINHMVENSTLAHYILDIVPDMTKELKEMSQVNSIVSSAKSIKDEDGKLNLDHLQTTYQLIKNSYQLGILTQEDIERYFNAVVEEINESDFTIEIPKKHQSDLDKLLEMPGISSKVKDSILQHVKVV